MNSVDHSLADLFDMYADFTGPNQWDRIRRKEKEDERRKTVITIVRNFRMFLEFYFESMEQMTHKKKWSTFQGSLYDDSLRGHRQVYAQQCEAMYADITKKEAQSLSEHDRLLLHLLLSYHIEALSFHSTLNCKKILSLPGLRSFLRKKVGYEVGPSFSMDRQWIGD